MFKLIMVACVVMSVDSDAGTKSAAQLKACKDACDVHYTKVYHECNGVAECEAYVRRDHHACFMECEDEQKD